MTARDKQTLCIPDLWHQHLAPYIGKDCEVVILKAVVTAAFTLDEHIDSFKPTDVFMFQRSTLEVQQSLMNKSYANKSGTVAEKLSIWYSVVDRGLYPLFSYYRMLPLFKLAGFPITKQQMLETNCLLSPWAREHHQTKWGFGGIDFSRL